MRLSTLHLQKFRDEFFTKDGATEFQYRILTDLIEYRTQHNLDKKYPYVPGSLASAEQYKYELLKLMGIFELMRQDPTIGDKFEFIEEFKKEFPPQEVDDIIEEYFPEVLVAQKPQ